ncbi:unnamed protein product [Lepeophtheirus salmonis]|uniref:(salmon louse) hypothetical protein n=1 Tax=Lepeophtheirus salmonis TaxID=72036 RepID=A0A7R8D225_LEPSM|nr:unnamed protein product [Lepeophtheirus salmonis]CAF2973332.1 unnamed protein product [Lepeophtheirus salmonis]
MQLKRNYNEKELSKPHSPHQLSISINHDTSKSGKPPEGTPEEPTQIDSNITGNPNNEKELTKPHSPSPNSINHDTSKSGKIPEESPEEPTQNDSNITGIPISTET